MVCRLLYCLAGLVLLVSAAYGEDDRFRLLSLTVPPATSSYEPLLLEATIGALPRGSLLNIETEGGQLIGTISPFGVTALAPQSYTLALPKDAVTGTTIRLRVQVQQAGGALRAPTSQELLGMELKRAPGG